jgi:hypothetical protein
LENHLDSQFQENIYVYEVYDNDTFKIIGLKITDITDTNIRVFSYIKHLPETQDSFMFEKQSSNFV